MESDYTKVSYEMHKMHYEKTFDLSRLNTWKNKDTVDYWRHKRMYNNLNVLIETYPGCSWLTVGDGRYGSDANYILSQGVEEVLATDISDRYLKIAKQEGFISDYKVENAEGLTFLDNSFDFVLCKEAYHHFPRPALALYEMLRVAKKGVVLIEPQDGNILVPSRFNIITAYKWLFRAIKNRLKAVINRKAYYSYGGYEDVGNYVYTVSEREIEKVALGLNLRTVCFKGINDVYIDGVEFENAHVDSKLFIEVKEKVRKLDKQSIRGLASYNILISIILKDRPAKDLMDALVKEGFTLHNLPYNPYV